MRIQGSVWRRDGERSRIEAAGGEFKDRVDLFPRDIEMLDDFLYAGACSFLYSSNIAVEISALVGHWPRRRPACV